jgi:hypothetical protein
MLPLAASLLLPVTAQASLITNGGFEKGLSGWICTTQNGACGTESLAGPREGDAYWYGFENGSGGMNSQSINTVAGRLYSLELWYGSSSSNDYNNLSVAIGDFSQAFDIAVGGTVSWTELSTTFTATSAISTLNFDFQTSRNSGTLWLDDIRIQSISVPEPATLWLLAGGLLGLGIIRRRKHLT